MEGVLVLLDITSTACQQPAGVLLLHQLDSRPLGLPSQLRSHWEHPSRASCSRPAVPPGLDRLRSSSWAGLPPAPTRCWRQPALAGRCPAEGGKSSHLPSNHRCNGLFPSVICGILRYGGEKFSSSCNVETNFHFLQNGSRSTSIFRSCSLNIHDMLENFLFGILLL